MKIAEINLLAKKLLIKTAQHWLFINAIADFLESFISITMKIKTVITADESYIGILLFVKTAAN